MSNSSSPRSVWSFIIKVIITVATAIGGLIGVQSCMKPQANHYADYHSLKCHAGRKIPFGGGLPTRSYQTPWIP